MAEVYDVNRIQEDSTEEEKDTKVARNDDGKGMLCMKLATFVTLLRFCQATHDVATNLFNYLIVCS